MSTDNLSKEQALRQAFAHIERQFGPSSSMRRGLSEAHVKDGTISTGSLSLDVALGIGGIPRGRITEIYGPEASGKTTLALHIIAEAQKLGGITAFIDAEHTLDAVHARNLGVDTEALLVSQPDDGEQALETCDLLVRSGALDVIVIDSVAALVPRAELDGEMADAPIGMQARLMSQGLRTLTAIISKSRTSVIFINQLRQKLGAAFDNPETTTGGHALTHSASVRLDVRRVKPLNRGDQLIGSRTRVRVVKNKLAPPFHQAEFDILYGKGISHLGELLDLGVEYGLVTQNGLSFCYRNTRLGQGRESAEALLQTSSETALALETQLRQFLGLTAAVCPRV